MDEELLNLMFKHKPDFSKLPGGVRIPALRKNGLNFSLSSSYSLGNGIDYIKNFLDKKDCKKLIDLFEEYGSYAPVTIQGLQEITDDNVGSNRITGYSPKLSNEIYKLLYKNSAVALIKHCDDYTPTDWWQVNGDMKSSSEWEFAGVSPMLRFMKYQKNGKHYPHYDAGFIYPDSNYRTLKSFVLYLTTNESGATRFIEDKQNNIKIWDRNHDDWDREPNSNEILERILPVKGDMLVFDHRICHDVESFLDDEGDRIIIRGDLIYKSK